VRCFPGPPIPTAASPCANGSPPPAAGDRHAAPWEELEVHGQGARPGDPPDQLHAAALLLRRPPAASQPDRVSAGSPWPPGSSDPRFRVGQPQARKAPGAFRALVASHRDVPIPPPPAGACAPSLWWEGRGTPTPWG